MDLTLITLTHVLVSLVAIVAGLRLAAGFWQERPTAERVFLSSTLATTLTGYLFPFQQLLPSHIVGVLSLLALAIAWKHKALRGRVYLGASLAAFYLNLLVLVAQVFKRVPSIAGGEGAAQLILLLGVVGFTWSVLNKADYSKSWLRRA